MSDPPVQCKGSCPLLCKPLIGISNNIGSATESTINSAIGRRMIVYRMDKREGRRRAVQMAQRVHQP